MRSHADDLRAEVADTPGGHDFVDAFLRDFRSAPLTDADRAMLEFAAKLTEHQNRMSKADTDELRAHGFDDPAILHIVQVTALFNYYTRLADGLHVDHEPEWSQPRADEPSAGS